MSMTSPSPWVVKCRSAVWISIGSSYPNGAPLAAGGESEPRAGFEEAYLRPNWQLPDIYPTLVWSMSDALRAKARPPKSPGPG